MRNPYVTERDILEQKQLFESLMQSTAMICAEFPLEEQPDTMEALLTAGFYCHHVTDKSTVPRPPALPVTIARASEHPFYAAPQFVSLQHCGVKTQDLLSRQTCHHHLPARATVPSRSQLPSPSYSFTLLSMPRAGGHELLMELGISTPQLRGAALVSLLAGRGFGYPRKINQSSPQERGQPGLEQSGKFFHAGCCFVWM
nr:uncharacterized protein LOC110363002 isoform X3 [Columba livia]